MTTTSRLVELRRPPFGGIVEPVSEVATSVDPEPSGSNAGDDARDTFLPIETPRVMELIELILKDRPRLDRVIRDPSLASELLPRFLAIALAGFTFFGIAATLVIASFHVWPELAAVTHVLDDGRALIEFVEIPGRSLGIARPWIDGTAYRLIAAYDLGLIAAAGVCLPSLYFYGLLSGVRMSMLDVTIHTLKAMATTAVALVGILPIYVALSMGVAVFSAPGLIVHGTLWLAMILPFLAGLWGVHSLYRGFVGLAETMPADRRRHRTLFLSRLIVSWAACYTAVTPVMIYTLWEYFARH